MFTAPDPYLNFTMVDTPEGRAGVFHTLRVMRTLVRETRHNPAIVQCAIAAIYLVPEKNEVGEVSAVFHFVRDSIRYTRDVLGVETISNPVTTLARRVGDCDDKALLLAALFESIGYPTRFVVAGYQNNRDFEHVYLQVYTDSGWLDCDPTETGEVGDAPGSPLVIFVEKL